MEESNMCPPSKGAAPYHVQLPGGPSGPPGAAEEAGLCSAPLGGSVPSELQAPPLGNRAGGRPQSAVASASEVPSTALSESWCSLSGSARLAGSQGALGAGAHRAR